MWKNNLKNLLLNIKARSRDRQKLYNYLVAIGKYSGCHQMPDRSFFIRDRQFPVCARCTGVFIGNIAAYALFLIYTLPLEFCLTGCAIMFVDWLVQYIGIRKSTNIRRVITGTIGGYSLTTLYCMAIKYAVQLLFLNN